MGKWWLKPLPRCWAQDQGTKSGQNRKRGSEHWQNLAKLVRGWSRTLGCATGIHCIQSILVIFWAGRELSSKMCAASPKSDPAIFDWRRYRDIVCQNPHYIVPNSKNLLEDDSTLSYLLLRWKFYMCADLPGYLKITWLQLCSAPAFLFIPNSQSTQNFSGHWQQYLVVHPTNRKWVITPVISGHCPHLSHWNHQGCNPQKQSVGWTTKYWLRVRFLLVVLLVGVQLVLQSSVNKRFDDLGDQSSAILWEKLVKFQVLDESCHPTPFEVPIHG